ncbi:hypothetical protein cyc_07833 [Cyclospora cayetanensis]|uniref:Uncharacterized protein n=1 Tax=Cyclospora cayetanensis TaxID=88456 RepID=A0A1D3D5Z9_9EIME|nr:hypothetical protein cyc_07833 [Cyclospora cayetanensis]
MRGLGCFDYVESLPLSLLRRCSSRDSTPCSLHCQATAATAETTAPYDSPKQQHESSRQGSTEAALPAATCVATADSLVAIGSNEGVVLLLRRPHPMQPLQPVARLLLPLAPTIRERDTSGRLFFFAAVLFSAFDCGSAPTPMPSLQLPQGGCFSSISCSVSTLMTFNSALDFTLISCDDFVGGGGNPAKGLNVGAPLKTLAAARSGGSSAEGSKNTACRELPLWWCLRKRESACCLLSGSSSFCCLRDTPKDGREGVKIDTVHSLEVVFDDRSPVLLISAGTRNFVLLDPISRNASSPPDNTLVHPIGSKPHEGPHIAEHGCGLLIYGGESSQLCDCERLAALLGKTPVWRGAQATRRQTLQQKEQWKAVVLITPRKG